MWVRLAPLVIVIHVLFVGAWITYANPFTDSREHSVERRAERRVTSYYPRMIFCGAPSAGKVTCYLDTGPSRDN